MLKCFPYVNCINDDKSPNFKRSHAKYINTLSQRLNIDIKALNDEQM